MAMIQLGSSVDAFASRKPALVSSRAHGAFAPATFKTLPNNDALSPPSALALQSLRLHMREPRSKEDGSAFFSMLSNPFSVVSSDGEIAAKPTSLPPGLTAIQTIADPVMDTLDDTSEFILSYADLRPDSSSTLPGQAFLATNILYAIVGVALAWQGDLVFGCLTEACSVASFLYHYTQLEARGEAKAPTVRLAVLVDYVCAITTLSLASFYLLTMLSEASIETFAGVALAISFLLLSWVYETGRPYMLFHSLWHIFGAYSGFLIGSMHNHVTLPSLL